MHNLKRIPPPKACIYNVLKLMLEELWNASNLEQKLATDTSYSSLFYRQN